MCLAKSCLLVLLAFGGAGCALKRVNCEDACREHGQCSKRTTPHGVQSCYAASDKSCKQSQACKTSGECFAAEDGTCQRSEDAPARACSQSKQCEIWGGCSPKSGWCVPASDAHCRASFKCRTMGQCTKVLDLCVARSADDCAASTGCAMEGLCDFVPGGFQRQCGVQPSPTACKASKACELFGRCEARSPGTRIFYCARPDEVPGTPCAGATDPVCHPDGLCLRNNDNNCVRPAGAPANPPKNPTERADRNHVEGGPVQLWEDPVRISATSEQTFPAGASAEIVASCKYGDRWFRFRTKILKTREAGHPSATADLRPTVPERCEVHLHAEQGTLVDDRTWCWSETETTEGPCEAGP